MRTSKFYASSISHLMLRCGTSKKMMVKLKECVGSFPVLCPMLTTFKVTGISPITIRWTRGKNGRSFLKTKRSKGWFSVSVFLLVVTIIHTLWAPTMLIRLERSIKVEFSKLKPIPNNSTKDNREGFTSKQTMVVKMLHPLLICITSLSARGSSVSVLAKNLPRLIGKINKVESVLGVPSRVCRKDGAILLSFVIVFFILNIPLMTYHLLQLSFFHSGWGNAWEAFSMFNIFTTFSMELQFMTFCYIARSRFIYVNTILTGFVSDEFSCKTSNFPASSTCKIDNAGAFVLELNKISRARSTRIIRSLRNGHILLFDVMGDINKIYQFQLLISIFSSISKILFNLYFSIFGFISSSNNLPSQVQRGQMYIVFLWTAYYCVRFLLVVSFAHATATESRKTKNILVKIDYRTFEETDKEEIKMFCENLSGRDFEFSACGLFNLNMALIASSFSSGITYLVIMAQFH